MPGIGVINNPKSRQNKLHPERVPELGYILGEAGSSQSTYSFEELEECIKDFKKRKIDILAINGGDGSNHVTLTKLIEIYGNTKLPKVALLRGGTLNTISRAFGIKGKPAYLLHNLSCKYSEGKSFETKNANLIKVNGKYSFLFANGFIANYMHTYYTTGTPSPTQGVIVLFRGIISVLTGTKLAKDWTRKIKARVYVDGEELETKEFISILAATIPDIGVGFQPWTRAFDEPDKFHALFFDCTPLSIVREIASIYFKRPLHPRVGEERLAKHILVEAEESFRYTLDGDMHLCEDGKMTIGIGPRLEIIVK